ncbi:MAG TPA: hypothetical protein VMB74_14690 [Streptosporangiaceae bacterium]|nr:hypothetical protein [Streptosporangiaceae bacterium]
MYQRMSEELARHRLAEVQELTAGRGLRPAPAGRGASELEFSELPASMSPRTASRARVTLQSLRMRTGWRLVDLGLKLAVTHDSRPAAAPRPAGS